MSPGQQNKLHANCKECFPNMNDFVESNCKNGDEINGNDFDLSEISKLVFCLFKIYFLVVNWVLF